MEQRIELAPNCSLTPAGARLFFAATCLFSLAFAMIFVIQGFWPVLPFWALEMAAFGLALSANMRRRLYTQTVLITDSQVSLVTRSRRGEAKQEFARHWTKVRLRTPRTRLLSEQVDDREPRDGPARSAASSPRRKDAGLAERLRGLVGGMNESPPLEH